MGAVVGDSGSTRRSNRPFPAWARAAGIAVGLIGIPLACSGIEGHFPNGKPPSFDDPSGGTGGGNDTPKGGAGGKNNTPKGGAGGGGGTSGTPKGGADSGMTGGAGAVDGPEPGPEDVPTIDLGGMKVPSDKVVVIIHIGQSNMAGRSQEPPEMFDYFMWYGHALQPGGQPDPKYDPMPLPYSPKLWMFNLAGKFVPAREPTSSDESKDAGAGPGMAILRAAAAKWPNHYIVSIGRGQSGMRGGYCAHFLERNLITNDPWSTTPPSSQTDVEGNKNYTFYTEVMTKRALQLKGKVIFGGIVALFGSTEDRTGAEVPSPPAVPYLSQCLIRVATTYRQALGDENIPFIISDADHGAGEFAYDGPLGKKVQGQVRAAQAKIPKSAIIPTDGIEMRDDHHFTMKGHKTWGDRAIDLIDQNGWAPWANP